jgi:hypothetical protein
MKLFQRYDGNKHSEQDYTRGHLFKENSKTALCGFKFCDTAAPIYENEYSCFGDLPFFPHMQKLCGSCYNIAKQTVYKEKLS